MNLRREINSALAEHGWEYIARLWRRVVGDQFQVLEFQAMQMTTGFRLNLGIHFRGMLAFWPPELRPSELVDLTPIYCVLWGTVDAKNESRESWPRIDKMRGEEASKALELFLVDLLQWNRHFNRIAESWPNASAFAEYVLDLSRCNGDDPEAIRDAIWDKWEVGPQFSWVCCATAGMTLSRTGRLEDGLRLLRVARQGDSLDDADRKLIDEVEALS